MGENRGERGESESAQSADPHLQKDKNKQNGKRGDEICKEKERSEDTWFSSEHPPPTHTHFEVC